MGVAEINQSAKIKDSIFSPQASLRGLVITKKMQNKANLTAFPAPATAFAVTSDRKPEILNSKSKAYEFKKKIENKPNFKLGKIAQLL